MDNLDRFPSRPLSHRMGDKALATLERAVAFSGQFTVQGADVSDYGVDLTLEANRDDGEPDGRVFPSNARVTVQVKGTAQEANPDNSVSISVGRTHLNYMLMQPYSLYICYHEPSDRLLYTTVKSVHDNRIEHGMSSTSDSVAVRFSMEFDQNAQDRLVELVISAARRGRDMRVNSPANPNAYGVHVPASREAALIMLESLLEQGRDGDISQVGDAFLAVLGSDTLDALPIGLAEINLGINGAPILESRIRLVIALLLYGIDQNLLQPHGAQYSLGNAYYVLKDYDAASASFSLAIRLATEAGDLTTAAMAHKNFGSMEEQWFNTESALHHYNSALELDPDLGEARHALATYHYNNEDFSDALETLAGLRFARGSSGNIPMIEVFRIQCLFQLDRDEDAFEKIIGLTGEPSTSDLVWAKLSNIVGIFGRSKSDNFLETYRFWKEYCVRFPDNTYGQIEHLLAAAVLRNIDTLRGISWNALYEKVNVFRTEDTPSLALIWDRLGHWAQDEGRWEDAANCYRPADTIDRTSYGYCLGTAYLFTGKFTEALEVLEELTDLTPEDGMVWHQLGAAQMGLKLFSSAAANFQKAIELEPTYEKAWFNLGGALWNDGKTEQAIDAWGDAIEMFPESVETSKVKKMVALEGMFQGMFSGND
ncbi:MAG: tetratricopeptide repeat protein [Alphaproteobacteria bacterium]